jgi:hypothetical protein
MPAVIPVHAAIRSDLRDSARHAVTLDARLESLIACKPWKPSGNFHGKIDFSQPPWYAPVAHCHLDLHALSRKLERELQGELGLPARSRGGSTPNTRKALDSVCRLAESADDFIVKLSIRELERWSRRASVALEITEIPKRLPRQPGKPEAPCPWCENHTLRIKPLEGEIYCVNPQCRDENGDKPKASMVYSDIIGDFTILWQDNVVGLP